MELALFIYLANTLGSIGTTLVLLGSITAVICIVICVPFALEAQGNEDLIKARDTLITYAKYGVLSMLIGILLPSKETMYTMAGAYAGQQVAQMEEVPEIMTKSLKVINKQLDEMLEEE